MSISKGSLYYRPVPISNYNLHVMDLIDKQYIETPYYGSRRMTAYLRRLGHEVNRKRVQRLMRLMGIEAIYPKPKLSQRDKGHRIYPYLLKGLEINRTDQVWSTDITYIGLSNGFMYLMAIMDWYSRYIISWVLSNSLEAEFCVRGLEEALDRARPEIFNTDQGSQFTSDVFIGPLKSAGVKISMDSRGRALDNVFIERLWRTVKYEEIYLKEYQTVNELRESLGRYFDFYNKKRLHQSLGYRTPAEVYSDDKYNYAKNI